MDQLSMFGGGDVALDADFASARRRDLDATSWVEYVPGWISGNEKLLASILTHTAFAQRKRWMFAQYVDEPRLSGECLDIPAHPEPFLATIAATLSARYGATYDGIWMNLYRDERDGTGWHGDPSLQHGRTSVVPVLSLGATRRFLLRSRAGGSSIAIAPSGGDLVVMGGRCQLDWQHSVPKQKRAAGTRVSLNFQSSAQFRQA